MPEKNEIVWGIKKIIVLKSVGYEDLSSGYEKQRKGKIGQCLYALHL